MSITYPTLQAGLTIDEIRNSIGRDVLFYLESTTTCDDCTLDPLTNTSTNSFCPTCLGAYYISTFSGIAIKGHVTWGNVDTLTWPVGGQVFNGDCRIQIKYTAANLNIVQSAKYIEIDNIKLKIKNYILRGVQILNRIVIILDQKEES